ncbi:hypothetical protein [Rufibacter soli]
MTNRLLFPEEYQIKITGCYETKDIRGVLAPEYSPLDNDPYYGLDEKAERTIRSKYMLYQEYETVFIYFSRAFLEIDYTGKPFFPYFKGRIIKTNQGLEICGSVRYNKLLSFFLPVLFAVLVLAVIMLNLPWFYLGLPILFPAIIKISSRNLRNELMNDLETKVDSINNRTACANNT